MLRLIKRAIYLIAMTMCISQASGCNNNDIPSVSAPEFEQQIKVDSVQLLDVRTPEEYAEGHIAGAVNIDVQSDDFQPTARQELSKDSTTLFYCRSGRRSLDAAEILARLGYRVVNLKGGILDWQASGLPVTTTTDKE